MPFISVGQDAAPGHHFEIEYALSFSSDPASSQRNTNEILTEMAKEVLKEPWKVEIRIGLAMDARASRGNSGADTLILHTAAPHVTGDKYFRLFDISDVLLPSRVSYTFRVVNRTDPSMFRETLIQCNLRAGGDTISVDGNNFRFDPGTDTLVLNSVSMSFDEDARNRFFARLAVINDYYACSALLDTLAVIAGQTGLQDAAALPWDYVRTREILHAIRMIGAVNFSGTLLSGGSDPKRFDYRFTASDKQSRSLRFTFRDALDASGLISSGGRIDSLADYFTGRVLCYVHLSQKMSGTNGEIYKEWLDHYFESPVFDDEAEVIALLAGKLFPDARADTLLRFLSVRLFDSYRRLALKQMEMGAYADAFALMEHASRFTALDPFYPKELMENETITRAARGIFDSYVGIAASCIGAGKFTMADRYLEKAAAYRKDNFYYPFSDSVYNSVFSDLFFRRNTECDQELASARYQEALSCYLFLEKTYDSAQLMPLRSGLEEKKRSARMGIFRELTGQAFLALKQDQKDSALYYFEQATGLAQDLQGVAGVAAVLDSLTPEISEIRIARHTRLGAEAVSRREFTRALREFGAAAALADSRKEKLDANSDSLYRVAVKQNLLITLSAQQHFIWINRFDSARACLERAGRTAAAFGLQSDPDIRAGIQRFLSGMSEKQCSNLNDTLLVQVVRSDRNRAMKNYLRSVSILQQVLRVASKNQSCALPVQGIRDSLTKYEKPAIYQQKQEEINTLLASGAYEQAVRLFTDNEHFFAANSLERFGLTGTTHYDFALSRGNPYLTVKIVMYYFEIQEYQESVQTLHLLQGQGYPMRNAAAMMEEMGKRMAASDLRVKPAADPAILAEKYTGSDSWFSPFRNSYVEEWKKIRSQMVPIH